MHALCCETTTVPCLSHVGVLSKRLNESSCFFAWRLFPTYPTVCYKQECSDIYKTKGTSLWHCVPNSGLRKFRHSISIVETCYQLSSRKVDAQSVINWTVVGQLSWQYLPATLDHCSLSQRLSCSVYSTIPSRGLISDSRYEYFRYQNWCKPRASK